MADLFSSELNASNEISSPDVAICGRVGRIIFEKPEDDFFIFTMRLAGTSKDVKVKGYALELLPGMEMDCTGKWESHAKFGDIFNSTNISEFMPTTAEGIRSLLHNGFVKDISKSNANDLVSWFGHKLFDVAEFKPERLREVSGISAKRLSDLSQTVKEKRSIPRIVAYLAEIGLTRGLAHRVFKELGTDAVAIIRKNPYSLTRIPRIKFADADRVARQLGIDANSDSRLSAAMEAVLIKEGEQGSTAMLRSKLLDGMISLLSAGGVGMDTDKVEVVLEAELSKQSKALLRSINGVMYVSSRDQYVSELRIAKGILAIHKSRNSKKVKSSEMSSKRFAHLDEDQIAAARMVLDSNFSIITGRPGCGKTTVTQSIVEVLHDANMKVLLCAPTGRAAKRIKEATGFEGVTIHRALGSKGPDGFEFNMSNPLPFDAVLVDEASMVGTGLMDRLIQAVAPGTKVILVGDKDQLASIEAGNVLSDCIRSGTVETYTLTEPHRFAKGSAIVTNSHLIIDGRLPVRNNDSDFQMHETKNDEELISFIIEQYDQFRREGFSQEEIQILTPMRKVTDLGSNNLNRILKEHINPGVQSNSITKSKFGVAVTLSVGDRVMQCSNNKELGIFNGDVGYIRDINRGVVEVDFSGDIISLQRGDLDDIDLAFASTIHKSQGCEYQAVIMPICKSHGNMLDRNLVYTGITRGKRRVSLIGDLWILKRVVEKASSAKRITGLEQCLWDSFDDYASKNSLSRISAIDSSYSLN